MATWQVWHDWQGTAVRGVSGGVSALLLAWLARWLSGIDPQVPSKNEVSGQFCLLVLPALRLLLDLCDAFVAMQSGVNCFDCRIASLGWAL